MQDWIVWIYKDKYLQATSSGSQVDGVDNACRFRPTDEVVKIPYGNFMDFVLLT
ncbi:hypothetical protein [Massilia agri]